MFRYVLKRLGYMIFTLWVIITLTFVMMHSVPGNPFATEKMSPAVLANLNAKYGLDRPLYEQYYVYLKNLVRGDLGISMRNTNRTVNELIGRTFPISAKLGLLSIAWSIPLGMLLGIIAALKRNKWQDRTAMVLTVALTSVPGFVIVILAQLLFGVMWQKWTGKVLLPVAGWGETKHMILPVAVMGLTVVGVYIRMMRTSMLDVLSQDYIKTARAKGLSSMEIIWRHMLRNAMMPMITILGATLSGALLGAVLMEQILGIPGLGRYFAQSITNSDYTLILGTTVFWSVMLLVSFFLVDIAYGLADPRVRLHKGSAT